MKHRNYYMVLGVSRTESISGIRAAFRKLAKEHHPDVGGPDKTHHFQEITEAYCVLSDPEARKKYDAGLRDAEKEEVTRRSPTVSAAPGIRRGFTGFRPEPFMHQRFVRNPSRRNVFENLFSGVSGFERMETERRRTINVEVILSETEAAQGGILPLPLFQACPLCMGEGYMGWFACLHCRGEGRVESQRRIRVRIPQGVRDGTVLDVPVGRDDAEEPVLTLRIRIRIA